MESGPIGPYLSEIAAVLHRNGYETLLNLS
jgi:hypothetical protein